MSFSLQLDNNKILKGIIEALSSILSETELMVDKNGFTIAAMDPSRICLLKLIMKKVDFDSFQCKKDAKVGINLEDFYKIIKRAGTNESIFLEFEEKDQKIKIRMKKETGTRARTFSLACLDIDSEEVPMDNLLAIEYDSIFKFDTELLLEAINDAEIYSEILNIKAEPEKGLLLSSTGQIGEMEYELPENELIESKIKEISTGAYSITFMKAIMKLASITDNMEISLKTDHPLKMIFNLIEGAVLNYFLAPRVEDADFDDDDEEF